MSQSKRPAGAVLALALALAGLLILAAAPSGAGGGVHWLGLDQALARQKTQGRPVLVFFHLPWCYRCKAMEAKVFPRKDVSALLAEKVIPAMVDVSKEEAAKAAYKVDYIPTFVLLAPDGSTILRKKGVIPGDEFADMLRYAAGGAWRKQSFDEFRRHAR